MKILFRTSGGQARKGELGLGHVYRCINLGCNLKPNEIYFLIEDYGNAKKLLFEKGYENIHLLKRGVDVNSDIIETVRYISKKNIDVLIVDKYNVKQKYLNEIKKFTKLVVISDLRNIDYVADLVVNGFIGFKNRITTNRYHAKCLLGPSYQILDNRYSKMKNSYNKKYTLLVTFGGFDKKNIVEIISKPLSKYLEKMKTKIILGPATIKSKKIYGLEKKYKRSLEVVHQTYDMPEEISNSEIGICAGGITTYEFAAMQVPFAIVCQYRHQLMTAREWQRLGVALNFGLVGNKTEKRIQKFFQDIVEKRVHYKPGVRYVDGLGAKRVSREILKLR